MPSRISRHTARRSRAGGTSGDGGHVSRRVVVTGVGLVSALGIGTDANWHGLLAGQSGAGPITRFDASAFSTRFAAEVKGFDPLAFLDKKDVKKMDPFIHYAIAASQFAVDDAGLAVTPSNADRVGVFIASGIGGFSSIEREHRAFLEGGPRKISPFFIPGAIINLASGQVSIRFGARGPNSATATACAASAHAVGDAFEIIRRGAADVMIAGGSEAGVCAMGVGGFAALRALSTRNDDPARASRPFDKDRDGFVLGEGSGVIILEALETAQARGVRIYAEMVGYGMSGDAFHMTAQPEDADGAYRSMMAALASADVAPTQVDYINAHGTSTPINDPTETLAVKRVFGDHAYRLAMSSTKSMTGHLLGAAGGLEAGISALVLRHQMLPPTINFDQPGEGCDLDYVPNTARAATVQYVLSNSFGFGGTNASLLFKRYE
ncbi:MAG: beta-ketoacyl-ACP synthase II [Acidobacteria bacterium]|nr:beta-ketoacyl-ACP synthase II [Acidobacteriota bacterium]